MCVYVCVFDLDHFNECLLNLPFSSLCTNAASIQIFVFSHILSPSAACFYYGMQRNSLWLGRHVSKLIVYKSFVRGVLLRGIQYVLQCHHIC